MSPDLANKIAALKQSYIHVDYSHDPQHAIRDAIDRTTEICLAEIKRLVRARFKGEPSEDQIKHMVNRFLGWRLPENFRPDAGISFKAEFNENTQWPMKHEPTGTNLFDATQADAMVRYMIDGMPSD